MTPSKQKAFAWLKAWDFELTLMAEHNSQDEVLDTIKAALQESGWLPLDDAAKVGIRLVTNGGGTWPVLWRDGKSGLGFYELGSFDGPVNGVTHYMPLPLPPEAVGEG